MGTRDILTICLAVIVNMLLKLSKIVEMALLVNKLQLIFFSAYFVFVRKNSLMLAS